MQQSSAPKVSYLFPLYKSSRFLDVIEDNITHLIEHDVEIILSDRNGDDTCIKALLNKFGNSEKIRYLLKEDNGDWVDNINGLISTSRGKYFKITPHDDTLSSDDHSLFVEALEQNEDAILAFGPQKNIDLNGVELGWPYRETPDDLKEGAWTVGHWLSMNWTHNFNGAFKGLVRADPIRNHSLLIRKTKSVAFSERTWLFALAILGRYQFVENTLYTKRYYEESTHRGWQITPSTYREMAVVSITYTKDLLKDPLVSEYVILDLVENANRKARLHYTKGAYEYEPIETDLSEKILKHSLPKLSWPERLDY